MDGSHAENHMQFMMKMIKSSSGGQRMRPGDQKIRYDNYSGGYRQGFFVDLAGH